MSDKEVEEFTQEFVRSQKDFYLRAAKLEQCEERLGIKSRKQSLISSKKNYLIPPRSQSSSPKREKRRAPLPPDHLYPALPAINTKNLYPQALARPSRVLTPTRKAPPPPKSKSPSPNRSNVQKKK